jgi:hypothetical protein
MKAFIDNVPAQFHAKSTFPLSRGHHGGERDSQTSSLPCTTAEFLHHALDDSHQCE